MEVEEWKPKTKLGEKISSGQITDIQEIFDQGYEIKEPQIVDQLLPGLERKLVDLGQRKGKFGGGQRTPFKQSQRKTAEGAKVSFATIAMVGNKNGYVGVGYGKSSDPVPARQIATRKAKLNLIPVVRGCGSWECGCNEAHSIPYRTQGKSGSVRIVLKPAPKGTGLVANEESKKLLKLAGISDIWSESFGDTRTRSNTVRATFNALKNLSDMRIREKWKGKIKVGR